jgi:hypothetical protein
MSDWKDEALCATDGEVDDLTTLNLFFEDYEADYDVREKIDALCDECPVKTMCLLEAIRRQSTGVHGGVYLTLGHYDRQHNKHKSLSQRRAEEEQVKELRRRIRQKDV